MSGCSGGRIASQLHAIPLLNSKLLTHSAIHCVISVGNQPSTTLRRIIAARTTSEGSTLECNSPAAATATDLATLEEKEDRVTDLATIDDVTDWFRLSYRTMYSRSNVRAKVERAEEAMLSVDPSRQSLSLQRDILPKTQVCCILF